MKRILFASAAAAGLIALAAPAAMADDLPAGKLQLKLGGYVEFQGVFFDNKLKNATNREFVQKAQVTIDGEAKADNGLSYGPHIEIRENADQTTNASNTNGAAGSSLRFTQTWLHVAGNFGRVEIGDRRGPGYLATVGAPKVGFGGLTSSYDSPVLNAGDNFFADLNWDRPANSNRSTKVVYYTPVFAGFQAGVSYAPEINKGDSVVVQNTTSARYTDIVEGSVNYKNTFEGVGVSASFNVNHLGAYGVETGTIKRKESNPIYGGLQVSYAGFTLGGGAGDQDGVVLKPKYGTFVSNAQLATGYNASRAGLFYNVGGSYQTGPYGIGVEYGNIETKGNNSLSLLNVGLAYTAAPGLILGADYYRSENDAVLANGAGTTDKDRGDYFILSTRLNF